MNLDHDFVQVSKLGEDPKKRSLPKTEHFFSPNSGEDQKKRKKSSSPKKEHFFPPNSSGHLRSDAYQSQIIGEGADVHRTVLKLLGGYSQIIGEIYPPPPPPPPGFGTPVGNERLLVAYC